VKKPNPQAAFRKTVKSQLKAEGAVPPPASARRGRRIPGPPRKGLAKGVPRPGI